MVEKSKHDVNARTTFGILFGKMFFAYRQIYLLFYDISTTTPKSVQ